MATKPRLERQLCSLFEDQNLECKISDLNETFCSNRILFFSCKSKTLFWRGTNAHYKCTAAGCAPLN